MLAKKSNIKEKIKLNLFSDKELLSKIRKINFNNSKIVFGNFASIKIFAASSIA